MRSELPSGTVTFLFTDVEGSTRLLHSLGAEAYADALAEHRRVVREACISEGGVEVDTQGDAFFFAFPTAPGALAAASGFTDALTAGPIEVRVGLHTGTPFLAQEGYVGTDVHRAARICASGHGGQVLVSASTAPLVELELRDLGEHRFKDLAAPERVYQLGAREFPPLKTLYRTNLPVPATPFLGRAAELSEVVGLVTSRDLRLLTLTGPGGTGKTRLALQAAAEASESFPDGVFWVALASLRDPALVVPAAAHVLGSKNGLAEHIADRSMLCLFDNFEQVVEAAPELASLVGACPNLSVLVTSRERLRVSGEQTYHVPQLAEADGEALFLTRARAVDPSFPGSEAVGELCLRLDELPLAIELAAARTAIFSPEQLLERLSHRLDLLKGERDSDPRQQTLRATIEWSYDLLDGDEQRLFRELSVFPGGCTFDAAEAVCGADPDTLQSLLDKSLMRRLDSELGPRYWMLETIREFAAEKGASDEQQRLEDAHLAYFARELEKLGWRARQRDPLALTYLRIEQANVLAALEHAVGSGAVEDAQRIVVGAWFYWTVSGLAAEGDLWAGRVAALPSAHTVLYALALALAGELARGRGDAQRALSLKTRALDVFGELDRSDPEVRRWVAACDADVADVYAQLGEHQRADEHARRALHTRRELGDAQGIAHALGGVGTVALVRGAYEEAAAAFEESAALLDAEGDRSEAAGPLTGLGMARRRLGDLVGARYALEDALERGLQSGDRQHLAHAHVELGLLAASEGNAEAAVRLLARASAELADLGIAVMGPTEADEALATCRSELGDDVYQALCAQGEVAARSGSA